MKPTVEDDNGDYMFYVSIGLVVVFFIGIGIGSRFIPEQSSTYIYSTNCSLVSVKKLTLECPQMYTCWAAIILVNLTDYMNIVKQYSGAIGVFDDSISTKNLELNLTSTPCKYYPRKNIVEFLYFDKKSILIPNE